MELKPGTLVKFPLEGDDVGWDETFGEVHGWVWKIAEERREGVYLCVSIATGHRQPIWKGYFKVIDDPRGEVK